MFSNKMETMTIPERVYSLCKIIENKPMLASDVKERMEPSYLGQKSVYFTSYRNTAEELRLINFSDNMLALAVDTSVIKSMDTMRSYINMELNRFSNAEFYQVTSAYFDMGPNILQGEQNVANLSAIMSQNTGLSIDADAMRAWRFWASYLGFGYAQGMFVLPNADRFLWDLIKYSKFEKNKKYSITEFLTRISPFIEIILDINNPNKMFNFGTSNGLRTLQDAGYIRMEQVLDEKDTWNLYHMNAASTNDRVTHITILR